jgi:protein MAK16
LKTIERAHLPA